MSTKADTHIRVSRSTKKKLEARGNKGETYDDILRRLAGLEDGAK